MSRFYITTPIYYINAAPHLGHAYTTMVADATARLHRLLGDEVFFLTGTDEHGQKVERAARKAGLEPMTFADQVSSLYRELFSRLNISNDDFIRTTEPRHILAAQELWRRVERNGHLYTGSYEGWYCTVDEVFVPETQLVDGSRCPICGATVERLREQSYFFRLSAFQEPLLRHYGAHPEFVEPEIRRNEMLSFIKAGLEDLSVSRTSFKWGIPVPDAPGHVMYVWFDALTNYMTAAGFGSEDPGERARFERTWPPDIHLVGKEIVRQHAVYWPAFLLAAGVPLPKQVRGHGFWLMSGAKMSKSLGNVVRPHEYVEVFGVDAVRYFVMREMVFGQDASFGDQLILTRYNADLANDLGNLVSRATTMIERYCEGAVPAPDAECRSRPEEIQLSRDLEHLIEATPESMRNFQFAHALREIWDVIATTNKYIVVREPWSIAKDPARGRELDTVLYMAADVLRVLAALIEPVMPETAVRVRQMLGAPSEPWTGLASGTLKPGTRLGKIEPLFPRIDHTVEELRRMSTDTNQPGTGPGPDAGPAEAAAVPDQDARISIDDFMKVELRVAKVLTAERVPNSKKLIKMTIDVGSEERTIVAGIAEVYEADSLVGRTIVVVFNLKPARLMGIESNGMVLAASIDGRPALLSVDGAAPPGTRVR